MRGWFIRYIVPGSVPLIGGLDLSIPAYFFFLTLGMVIAVNIVIREANRSRLPVAPMLDLAILILFSGLIGGRLGHIFLEMPGYYLANPMAVLRIWQGGLVYYGGLIFSVGVAIVFCRVKKLDFWRVADVYAPAIAFGLTFGRMGCLSAGCCFGKPADFPFGWSVPWAITFYSGQVEKDLYGVPLHPTQLYEGVSCIFLFLFLVMLRKRQKFDGQVLWTFLAIYSVLRSIIEIFRFDLDRGVYLNGLFSTSQGISLALFVGALTMMPILARRARRNGSYGLGAGWPEKLAAAAPPPPAPAADAEAPRG